MRQKILESLVDFWFEPVQSIRLDTFRVCLGAAIFLYMQFRWQFAREWLTSAGFHVSLPNLPYHDLLLPLLPESWLLIFGFIFWGSLVAFIIGWQTRWVGWIFLVCLLYVTFADQLAAFSPNKIIVVSLLIVCAAPLGSHWSVQSRAKSQIAVWPIRILQISFIAHMTLAGWVKIGFGEWLTNPYVLWTQVQGTYRSELTIFFLNIFPPKMWILMQYSALMCELLTPVLFIIKRFRWIGFLWGGLLQLMIALTMHCFGYFNLIMLCFFVLFMEEDTLYRLKDFGRRFIPVFR